ncbi:amino acid racemase [Bradyrhizobium sp.]|uniref:aspartate/glutamate racemase family protein n=1 Tax=Bradyrhizobium sp. TaxID=376 RepID=UPI0025C44C4D|nr:amino acid racemase [Bradyrhizobium sp.]
MDRSDELVVGVMGGLGPEATHDFFGKVLAHSNARTDQQHLHLIIDNNPKTPNRNDAIAGVGPSPGPALATMAQRLEEAGADFIVMACNTAHAYEKDIRRAISKPFVSLIDEVVAEVRRSHSEVRRVGLLAAQGCIDSQIYHKAFRSAGIEVVTPDPPSQSELMKLIYRIKSGERDDSVRSSMRALAERLSQSGVGVLIAGCTEVPLVLTSQSCTLPLVDSTDVLARRCVSYARRTEPLPAGV